jgi:Spy/CpxP family protein refolding chaperone
MKKTLITLAILAIVPTVAMAGFGMGPGHGMRGGPNPEFMARVLDLTPEQKDKMQALWAEQAKKRDEMRAAMRTDMQAKMQSILTKEQYAKMTELRQMRGGGPGLGSGGGAGMGQGMGRGGCTGMGPRGNW